MLIPDFTENKDDCTLLYFCAENADINELKAELEKTYVCFSSVSAETRNGKSYAVLSIADA